MWTPETLAARLTKAILKLSGKPEDDAFFVDQVERATRNIVRMRILSRGQASLVDVYELSNDAAKLDQAFQELLVALKEKSDVSADDVFEIFKWVKCWQNLDAPSRDAVSAALSAGIVQLTDVHTALDKRIRTKKSPGTESESPEQPSGAVPPDDPDLG